MPLRILPNQNFLLVWQIREIKYMSLGFLRRFFDIQGIYEQIMEFLIVWLVFVLKFKDLVGKFLEASCLVLTDSLVVPALLKSHEVEKFSN